MVKPAETARISPTIAQGSPSDRHHLYAAVRFPCATFRAVDRGCEVSTRPSLRPLGFEGGEIKQSSGEMRCEDAKVCSLSKMQERRVTLSAPYSVIASAAKQPRIPPWKDSGLLRCARNDGARGIGFVLQIQLSFPAKAENPVRRGLSIQSPPSQSTGSPGQAGR